MSLWIGTLSFALSLWQNQCRTELQYLCVFISLPSLFKIQLLTNAFDWGGHLITGRISPETRARDLEDVFGKYGRIIRCDVKRGFAFVEFEDDRDGDDALKELDGSEILGHRVVVEWAKGRRRGPSERDKCFRCGREGHWARDCHNTPSRGRRRSSSRSPRRRHYSHSPRRRHHSRSPKRHKRHYSRSRSPSPSPSHSRSPPRKHSSRSERHSRTPSPSNSQSPRPTTPCRSPSRSPSDHSMRSKENGNNENSTDN